VLPCALYYPAPEICMKFEGRGLLNLPQVRRKTGTRQDFQTQLSYEPSTSIISAGLRLSWIKKVILEAFSIEAVDSDHVRTVRTKVLFRPRLGGAFCSATLGYPP